MKEKKIGFIFIILFIVITVGGFFAIKFLKNNSEETTQVTEYTPQEEISDTQARQTIVTLYFQDKESKALVPEARLIDIKEILSNPAETLVNLLIEGPKGDKQERLIPENAKLEKNFLEGDVAVLEFSGDFSYEDFSSEIFKSNFITSIKNTLTQLTEINDVKIIVNGEQFN